MCIRDSPGLIQGQAEEECPILGDVNADQIINIQDVIIVVSVALNNSSGIVCGDINNDNTINIQDIILIVNEILE